MSAHGWGGLGFCEPIEEVDDFDAVVVADGQFVQGQYYFFVVVSDGIKGFYFAVKGFFCCHIGSDLNVGEDAVFLSDEVNFRILVFSDAYSISASKQFEENDVFY